MDTHLLSSRVSVAIAATLCGANGGFDNSGATCARIGARSANDFSIVASCAVSKGRERHLSVSFALRLKDLVLLCKAWEDLLA